MRGLDDEERDGVNPKGARMSRMSRRGNAGVEGVKGVEAGRLHTPVSVQGQLVWSLAALAQAVSVKS